MNHVMLFGASGYIGAHVLRALSQDPRVASVVCLGRDRFDLVHGDPGHLTELIREAAPDTVVNCTGRLTGSAYDLVMANATVTAKLVDAIAAAAPGARFVRLGSAAEYGPVAPGHRVSESDPPAPVSEYGLTHLAGTRLVEVASADGRVDGAVLRVFNPIGPGLREDTLLGRAVTVLRQARDAGQARVVFGSLAAYRDFVDVRDVASAVVAAAMAPRLHERVFNVGSGKAVLSRDAIALLAEAAGYTGQIGEEGSAPSRSAAVSWIEADIDRAARTLGWSPAHDLAGSVKNLWASVPD